MQFTHPRLVRCLSALVMVTAAPFAEAQTYNSGSTGADGPLNLTTPGTIIFNPTALGLNPVVPNVFNFTTINIAAGVTVKLSSKNVSGPLYWLAQGAVTINGTLDLSGEDGVPPPNNTASISTRVPAAGGAGGYNGGVGGASGSPNVPAAQPGNGPGGGAAATGPGLPLGGNGSFSGSLYLIPLIGGSGGGGGSNGVNPGFFGGGGGGGGGAILIASSVSITYGGLIKATGGAQGGGSGASGGGAGAGGAIRLIAPTISSVGPGDGNCDGGTEGKLLANTSTPNSSFPAGNNGVIRLEAFDLTRVDTFVACIQPPAIMSTPFNVVPPATAPSSLKVTSLVVGGTTIPINANPFSFPDATINSSSAVTVNVQAQFVPIGTVPKIIVMSETGPDQTVNCSAGLTGALPQSTCSAQITFPTGGSRGFVKATW